MAQPESRSSGELDEPGTRGDLGPGTHAGQYVITQLVARGGCGSVYRAHHESREQVAAVKVLHGSLAVMPKMVERFRREVDVVAMLHHPNIIEIFEIGQLPDGRPFYAMEYLQGRTLSAILEEEGRMPPPEVLEVLAPVCEALNAAHKAGVIHRDVKASNIMVIDGSVKLLDFGIAKLIGPQASPMGLTSEGRQVGTLTIMAPEQLLGGPVDARIDVYALGVLLYRLLTAKLPFDGKNALTLAQQHLEEPAPRPSTRIPTAPALDAVVLRAMEKRPERRYDSALDFLAALRRAVAGTRARLDSVPDAPALGVGVYVEIRMPSDAEDLDDAMSEDVGVILDLAEEELRAAGFLLAAVTGNSVLGVRPLPADPIEHLRARRGAVEAAAQLHEKVSARPQADARVHTNVTVHVDELLMRVAERPEVAGGALVRTERWAPRADAPALCATSTAVEGITSFDATPLDAGGAILSLTRRQGSRGIA